MSNELRVPVKVTSTTVHQGTTTLQENQMAIVLTGSQTDEGEVV